MSSGALIQRNTANEKLHASTSPVTVRASHKPSNNAPNSSLSHLSPFLSLSLSTLSLALSLSLSLSPSLSLSLCFSPLSPLIFVGQLHGLFLSHTHTPTQTHTHTHTYTQPYH